MFLALRRKAADTLLLATDVAGLLLAGSGAAVVAFFGKFMLAVVLGAVSLGFFLRLAGRRRQPPVAAVAAPWWCHVASLLLSVVEVSVLAEAADLPVRFSQPGFQLYHWLLVLVVLFAAYRVQLQVFRSAAARRSGGARS